MSRMDRNYLEQCLLENMTLRRIAAESRCSLTRVRYWVDKYGLEISRPPWRKYSDAEIRDIASGCSSVSQVIRKLGLRVTGSNHTSIKRRLTEVEISFGSGLTDRPRHSSNRKTADEILVRLPPNSCRKAAPMLRRALAEIGVPNECALCGQSPEWMGRPLTLEVDHIDGDPMNNERWNLRVVCPNCHTQTESFGNRNRMDN